jgi:hypothetical protein
MILIKNKTLIFFIIRYVNVRIIGFISWVFNLTFICLCTLH